MKVNAVIITAVLTGLGSICGIGQAAKKPAVAVVNLNPVAISDSEAKYLTERLIIELQKTAAVEVLEREKMDEILKEQGFQQTGACDNTACLVEIGRLLPVEKIIGGSAGKIGTIFSIQLRMIDVKTGEVERTASSDSSKNIEQLLISGIREASARLVIEDGTGRFDGTQRSRQIEDRNIRASALDIVNVDSLLKSKGLKPIFNDQFYNMNSWEAVNGDWEVDGGKLHGRAGETNIYRKYTKDFPDYGAVRFIFNSMHDYGAGFLFRMSQDKKTGLCVHFFSGRGMLSVYPDYDFTELRGRRQYNYHPVNQEWNEFTILFEGEDFLVLFNSKLIHRGSTPIFPGSPFYLCTGAKNEAWFDDFTLYSR